MKLINDTLKTSGKYSIKRISAFVSFHIATIYAFIPVVFVSFEVQEFVFWGFITYSASAIGLTVWNKKIDKDKTDLE